MIIEVLVEKMHILSNEVVDMQSISLGAIVNVIGNNNPENLKILNFLLISQVND